MKLLFKNDDVEIKTIKKGLRVRKKSPYINCSRLYYMKETRYFNSDTKYDALFNNDYTYVWEALLEDLLQGDIKSYCIKEY